MHLVHEGVSAAPGADFSFLEEKKGDTPDCTGVCDMFEVLRTVAESCAYVYTEMPRMSNARNRGQREVRASRPLAEKRLHLRTHV